MSANGTPLWERRAAPPPGEITPAPYAGGNFPVVYDANGAAIDLVGWAATRRAELRQALARHGALLFRGFKGTGVEEFEAFVRTVSGEPTPYVERSSPRTALSGHIYTSTDHPRDREIFLHCEQSYNIAWPMRIFFHCVQPADQGGATPVADCRKIWSALSDDTRDAFRRRGYAYVRNYIPHLGVSWREAFGSSDREEVREYCRTHGIEATWISADHLQTRQVRPAVSVHPQTGEEVWFNHIAFFHYSTLDPDIREVLLENYGVHGLPSNVFYGDGGEIEPCRLDEIRRCMRDHAVPVAWRRGDILMLDNMLMAHGREAFTGPRRVVVAMSEPSIRPGGG